MTEGSAAEGRPPVYFRAGVAAAIVDSKGRVLVLERADVPGAWQTPQGGLDSGEDPEEAVLREVFEETGIEPGDLEVVARHPRPLVYELPEELRSPKTGRGQVQYWFLVRPVHDGVDPDPASGVEFQASRWVDPGELEDLVVGFRKPVYAEVARWLRSEPR